MLAAFKLRAVPINVNYRYVEDELVYLFDNADVVAVRLPGRSSPRSSSGARTGSRCCATSSRSTTARGTAPPTGAVAYEEALAAASPERDFGPRDRRRPLHPLHRRHHRVPKGVMWRHEDVWRTLGGGIDFVTGERIEDEHQHVPRSPARRAPAVGLVLAPLMHGAAQWGTLGGLIKGPRSCCSPSSTRTLVWERGRASYRIATIAITGDAMALPLIDALREHDVRHCPRSWPSPPPPRCSRRW